MVQDAGQSRRWRGLAHERALFFDDALESGRGVG
jgi:hypothetical protein